MQRFKAAIESFFFFLIRHFASLWESWISLNLTFKYLVFLGGKNGPLSCYTNVSYVTPRHVLVGQDNIDTRLNNAMNLMFVFKLSALSVYNRENTTIVSLFLYSNLAYGATISIRCVKLKLFLKPYMMNNLIPANRHLLILCLLL